MCPRESVTLNGPPPATTCALVTTSPRLSNTTPEPRPCGLDICTTCVGAVVFTALVNVVKRFVKMFAVYPFNRTVIVPLPVFGTLA